MQAYFISDLHLTSMEERNSQKLLRFLLQIWQQPAGSVTHLCFLGDIFDVWVSDHEVFVKRWTPIIKAIDSLIKKHHCQFIYVEGNHDLHLAKYWEKTMGATVLTEPFTGLFGTWVIHLTHGDLINTKDKDYLEFRKKLRSPWMTYLAHRLPGGFWSWFGARLSQRSAKKSRQLKEERSVQLVALIRKYAQKIAEKDRCDYVITGHFHTQDEFEFKVEDRNVKSINLGTWLENPKAPIYRIDDTGGGFIDL